jgi:hypothetical protein
MNYHTVCSIEPGTKLEDVAINLLSYIQDTEVPILSEYCASISIYEEVLQLLANNSEPLKTVLKILENKKRAALERKIYTAELNATIGAHLLKIWHESKPDIREPKVYKPFSIAEMDAAGFSNAEINVFCDLLRKIEHKERSC